MRKTKNFLREYGRDVFWHWDAKVGYATTAIAAVILAASPVARLRLNDVGASGVTVDALGLTFALTSMSLLSAIVDPRMVEVLDGLEKRHRRRAVGLHGLLTAFRSVAAIGACGVVLWMLARALSVRELSGNGWESAQVVIGALAAGATTWLLAALVSLVRTVAVLVSGKAALIRSTQAQDKEIRPAADSGSD